MELQDQILYADTEVKNNEVILDGSKPWIVKIGNPQEPVSVAIFRDGNQICAFSPHGFTEAGQVVDENVLSRRSLAIGREKLNPLGPGDQIDNMISREHCSVELLQGGNLVLRDTSRNGTGVAGAIDLDKAIREVDLNQTIALVDSSRVYEFKLSLGKSHTLSISSENGQLVIKEGEKVVGVLSRKKDGISVLTLGRQSIAPEDKSISRKHVSLILTTEGKLIIFDHSTNGTRVLRRDQMPNKEKDRLRRYQPKILISKVFHTEQQISNDPNSVGGDYYLFGENVTESDDLLKKGGNAVVLMDTATIQSRRETPATTTAPFAKGFLKEYYRNIANRQDPETAAKNAFREMYDRLGKRTEATFTFVTVVDDTVYVLWIGNTEAVRIDNNGKINKLADSSDMVGKRYYDEERRAWVSPTILVNSGPEIIRFRSFKLGKSDKIIIYTDGVETLNPISPEISRLKRGDDAVLIELSETID